MQLNFANEGICKFLSSIYNVAITQLYLPIDIYKNDSRLVNYCSFDLTVNGLGYDIFIILQ